MLITRDLKKSVHIIATIRIVTWDIVMFVTFLTLVFNNNLNPHINSNILLISSVILILLYYIIAKNFRPSWSF